MELIAKISKGSKMDQIYLPKNRTGLSSGEYVVITPLESKFNEKEEFKPFFYNISNLEPLKLGIIENIFRILEHIKPKNIIITGSFLEKGFKFNDVDILIIIENKIDIDTLKEKLEKEIGIKSHLIPIDNKTLAVGLSTDPLYSLMLNRCVSKKRLIFKTKRLINYKTLDFQLLKSKTLIDNFNMLNGEEKYYFILNLMAILLFIKNKKLSKKVVDDNIEGTFGIKISEIKQNLIEKDRFIKKYKKVYNKTFNTILDGINEQK